MATVQTDGSTAVTKTSTINNGGTAMNVGSSSTVLDNKSLGSDYQGVFASTPVSDATIDYADLALSGGTFKYENQRGVTQRVTTSLAGVANTALKSAAGVPGDMRSIHRQEKVRTTRLTTAIRAGYWNIYSGSWSTSPTTAVDNFWDIANDTTSVTSTDQAASPSRNVPGELTYKLGQQTPVSVDYSAKTT